jgi:tetratricopeptide (TPR) repeat protein
MRKSATVACLLVFACLGFLARRARAQDWSDWSDAETIVSNFRSSFHQSNWSPSWRPSASRRRSAEAYWAVQRQQQAALARARQRQEARIRAQEAAAAAARAAERRRQQRILAEARLSQNWFQRGRAAGAANHYPQAIFDYRQAIAAWPYGGNSQFTQNLQDVIEQQRTLNWLHQNYEQASARLGGPGARDNAAPLRMAAPGGAGGNDEAAPLTLATPANDGMVAIATAPDGSQLRVPVAIAGMEAKGMDAIRVHDWEVALAWYETAQLKDPGDMRVARMVTLLRALRRHDGDPYNYYSGAGVIPPQTAGARRRDIADVAKLLYEAHRLRAQQ